MPKVLFIGPLPPPIGGTRIQVKLLVEALEPEGHIDKLIPLDVTPGRVSNMVLQLRIFLKILWSFPQYKIIAFHANPLRIAFWGPIFLLYARLLNKKIQFRFLGGDLDIIIEERKWLKTLIGFLHTSDQLVFETKGLIAFWKKHISADSNLIWFPNSRYALNEPKKQTRAHEDKVSLIFAGHVKREKGVGLICEAFQKFNSMHPNKVSITLVGRCEETALEEEIKRSNLNFLGELSHQETVTQMHKHDAFIFPTYWKGEGHPGVLIEAMQAGLPLLCADWRFVGELVEDGYNGRLYEPQSVEAVISVLEELIESPERLGVMSTNSLQFVKKYDAEYWMKEMYPRCLKELNKRNS